MIGQSRGERDSAAGGRGRVRASRRLSALLLALVSGTAVAQAVGTTRGSFSVGQDGAASYSVPIAVPPGIAGMEPKLAIAYSSHGGNGPLGVGWGLSGLSAITRCPQTQAQDGARGAVTYTSSDRFCLDGQRLIAVAGSYGASDTEYRTEMETFTRVRSIGGDDGGPQYFVAQTKSGLTMEFGASADSRVEVVGMGTPMNVAWRAGAARAWALTRVRDVAGNEMTVRYAEFATGEHVPIQVLYAGGRAQVQFIYQPRPDVSEMRHQGAVSTQSIRMNAIRTVVDGIAVKEYRLDYASSPGTARSLVEAITECAGDGQCLAPVRFTMRQEAGCCVRFGTRVGGGRVREGNFGDDTSYFDKLSADLDGDGRSDVLLIATKADGMFAVGVVNRGAGEYDVVVREDGESRHSSDDWNTPVAKLVTDINGDGLADVILVNSGNGRGLEIGTLIGRGDGRFDYRPGNAATGQRRVHDGDWGASEQWDKFAADVDGDGIPEVVLVHTGRDGLSAYVVYMNRDGTVREWRHSQVNTWDWGENATYQRLVADVNADGKADLLLVAPTAGGVYVYSVIGDGSGVFAQSALVNGDPLSPSSALVAGDNWYGGESQFQSLVADVNGDGKLDLVLVMTRNDGLYASSFIGRGNGKFDHVGGNPANGSNRLSGGDWGSASIYSKSIGDVNMDGRSDVLLAATGSSGVWLYTLVSRGDGTFDLTDGAEGGPRVNEWDWGGWSTYARMLADIDGDGRPEHLFVYAGPSGLYVMSVQPLGGVPDQVIEITNGLGMQVAIEYRPLTDPEVYERGRGSVWPVVELQLPIQVVTRVTTGNRSASPQLYTETSVRYRYGGLRATSDGRGLLGLAWVESLQEQTGLHTRSVFGQGHPFTGMALASTDYRPDGGVLRSVTTQPACIDPRTNGDCVDGPGQIALPYAAVSTERRVDLNGRELPSATTRLTLDRWGNAVQLDIESSDGHRNINSNEYAPADETAWILGRLVLARMHAIAPGDQQERTTGYGYGADGRLTREIIEPFDAKSCVVTEHGHDGAGNRTESTIRPCNGGSFGFSGRQYSEAAPAQAGQAFEPRIASRSFGSDGRFPVAARNALGQREDREFDTGFGVTRRVVGPNGLATSWTFDGFGRRRNEVRADGTVTTWRYGWCRDLDEGECPVSAVVFTEVAATGVAPVRSFEDSFGRVVATQSIDAQGAPVRASSLYDRHGRLWAESLPRTLGAVGEHASAAGFISGNEWRQFEYDVLGRIVAVHELFSGVRTTTEYDGLSVTSSIGKADASGGAPGLSGEGMPQGQIQRKIATANSRGQTVAVRDAAGGSIDHRYDAFGNLVETRVNGGAPIAQEFDRRGRRIAMHDPDSGTWRYEYDALGQLVRQFDAKGAYTEFRYDRLGRMVARDEREDRTTSFDYDVQSEQCAAPGAAIGRPTSTRTSTQTALIVCYDALGRPVERITLAGNTRLAETATYDAATGRLDTVGYPNAGTTLRYGYAANDGRLAQIIEGADRVIWRAEARNAAGRVTSELLGFEPGGAARGVRVTTAYEHLTRVTSVASDTDGTDAARLAFAYDTLGNLGARTWWDGAAEQHEQFGYDVLNRLLRADSGTAQHTYRYDARGNIVQKNAMSYRYGGGVCGSNRPHAVAVVTGFSPDGRDSHFVYDANGALVEERLGDCDGDTVRSITWTNHHLPARITRAGAELRFWYAGDNARIKQEAVVQGVTTVTYYAGSQERIEADGMVEHKLYVSAEGRMVASIGLRSDGREQRRYFVTDHLGSPSVVFDPERRVVERQSFDPWGERRSTAAGAAAEPRGFTGHEHLDSVGLIHMNGRIYDPALGRFMSPDPIVQAPTNSQSLNRYTYVLNNPLGYTDPSGYKAIWKRVRDSQPSWSADAKFGNSIERFAHNHPQQMVYIYLVGSIVAGVYGGPLAAGGVAAFYTSLYTDDDSQIFKAFARTALTGYAFYAVGEVTTIPSSDVDAVPYEYYQQMQVANVIGHAAVGAAAAAASGDNVWAGAFSGAAEPPGPTMA